MNDLKGITDLFDKIRNIQQKMISSFNFQIIKTWIRDSLVSQEFCDGFWGLKFREAKVFLREFFGLEKQIYRGNTNVISIEFDNPFGKLNTTVTINILRLVKASFGRDFSMRFFSINPAE